MSAFCAGARVANTRRVPSAVSREDKRQRLELRRESGCAAELAVKSHGRGETKSGCPGACRPWRAIAARQSRAAA